MEELKTQSRLFTIQLAAELSGLTTHTIRAWEKRYQALKPNRSESGRRLYTEPEVERLTLLGQLTQLGSSIGQIANLPDEELKEIYLKLTQHTTSLQRPTSGLSETELNQRITQLFAALKDYQMGTIVNILEEMKQLISPREMALQVLGPMLKEAKKLQLDSKISDAELHALNAVLKFQAGNIIYSYFQRKVKTQSKIALTTLEGDYHATTLLLAALVCCHHRINFFYLNANLPTFSIIEATKAIEATVLILTITPDQAKQKQFEETIHQIMNEIHPKTKVILLGEGADHLYFKDKWKNLDLIQDLEHLDTYLEKVV